MELYSIVALGLIFFSFLMMTSMYLFWNLVIIVGFLYILKRQKSQKNPIADQTDEELLRQEAVAVAVSVALAQKHNSINGYYPLPPTAIVSAWQAVLRSQVVKKQGVMR